MTTPNTNYPWSIIQAGDVVKDNTYQCKAEDTTIVDKDGYEVVGCSEWIRGDENFKRIILCVNACAHLTDNDLKDIIAASEEE